MQASQNVDISRSLIAAAGMEGFKPTTKSYSVLEVEGIPISIVPVGVVRPPTRNPGVETLNRERSMSILSAFWTQTPLPALEVDEAPGLGEYRYRVRDGFHRFYLAIAMGYECFPVSVQTYFDINNC